MLSNITMLSGPILLTVTVLCLCFLETVTCDAGSSAMLINKRQAISESQIQPSTSAHQAPTTPINTAPLATNTGELGSATSGGSVAVNSSNPLAALPTYSSFGNSVYPGRATFITPTRTRSMNPLYRIDPRENITFAWEFKDLKIRPINMTLAAVGPNSVTYTISVMNGGQTSAIWHLSDVPGHTQLMNGYYGIQLYDQRGISAYHQPGWLSPQTQLTIALYTISKYQNSTETTGAFCPFCFYDDAGVSTFGSLFIAFSIACITSAFFIYSFLY